MSETIITDHRTGTTGTGDDLAAAVPAPAGPLTRRHGERGLTTIEYALGIALIIAVIGALIVAAEGDFFGELVQGLFKELFQQITKGLVG